jgi:hypothetical protein
LSFILLFIIIYYYFITMIRPDFGYVFQVLKVSCVLQQFRLLGYLTGPPLGPSTVLTRKCIDFFKLNLVCCVTDMC